jgi:antitoxin ParD1/3/4
MEVVAMATMNVSLPEAMKDWAEAQVLTGHYGDVSDYVRDLIRKDQVRNSALRTLQAAIDEGLASGEAIPFDPTEFKMRMRERYIAGSK